MSSPDRPGRTARRAGPPASSPFPTAWTRPGRPSPRTPRTPSPHTQPGHARCPAEDRAAWHRIIATCVRLGIPVVADRGYQGAGDIVAVPHRRKPGKDLTLKQKCVNRAHARLRWPVERAIAEIKTWRILRKARNVSTTGTTTHPASSHGNAPVVPGRTCGRLAVSACW
ncbi:transposase family protein [Streptomyces sp. NPDC127051]|uniref:transposase family protein n=1 Tax=Streptomyces sp. NPDC127051 TaxID=3347119 RepID=UPI00364744E9